jgi:hypothetical protein
MGAPEVPPPTLRIIIAGIADETILAIASWIAVIAQEFAMCTTYKRLVTLVSRIVGLRGKPVKCPHSER